jgi:hypothetical protein
MSFTPSQNCHSSPSAEGESSGGEKGVWILGSSLQAEAFRLKPENGTENYLVFEWNCNVRLELV